MELFLDAVAHFHYHTGVFGKQGCNHVASYIVQVYMHAACGIGKAHLEQCGDETSCGDIMSGHDPTLVYHLLHGIEGVAEIFRIGHCGHVVAYFAEALGKGAASQFLTVE